MTAATTTQQQPQPSADQQREFQKALAIQQAIQNEHFFKGGYPFPWNPPGIEFWTALLDARKAKKSLEKKHRGPPNKKAPKEQWVNEEVIDKRTGEAKVQLVPPPAYMFVSADDYVEELDRACLPQGLVVVPSAVAEPTPTGGRNLAASYWVAHASTGQGMVFRADTVIGSSGGMGDPTKKAYTDSLAMFSRGFLAIARTNAPVEEELDQGPWQPPPSSPPSQQGPFPGPFPQGPGPGVPQGAGGGYPGGPPQPGGFSGGAGPGRGPGPMAPPNQQQPFQQGPGPGPGAPPDYGHPPHGRPPVGPSQQAYGPPPGGFQPPFQGQPSFQGPGPGLRPDYPYPSRGMPQGPPVGPPPAAQEQIVQYAHGMLGPNAPPPGYGTEGHPGQQRWNESMAPPQPPAPLPKSDQNLLAPPPPAQPAMVRGAQEGEPQTVEAWRDVLVSKGWDPDTALQLSGHKGDEPIPDALREETVTKGLNYYGSAEKVRAAFAGTGFEPQPGLPPHLRPKPTGIQLLRYAAKMDYTSQEQSPCAGLDRT